MICSPHPAQNREIPCTKRGNSDAHFRDFYLTKNTLTSLPEVVGEGALIVDAYDVENMAKQLIHLVCDDELRSLYSKKGIQQALKFSWTNTAEKTLQTYNKVMFEE